MSLKVRALASTSPKNPTAEDSLVVVLQDGAIYWQGKKLNGGIDTTGPNGKSKTHPMFTMTIDGERVMFGNPDATKNTFEFKGETLTVIPLLGRGVFYNPTTKELAL